MIRFCSLPFRLRIVRTHRNIFILHISVHLYTLARMPARNRTTEEKKTIFACLRDSGLLPFFISSFVNTNANVHNTVDLNASGME